MLLFWNLIESSIILSIFLLSLSFFLDSFILFISSLYWTKLVFKLCSPLFLYSFKSKEILYLLSSAFKLFFPINFLNVDSIFSFFEGLSFISEIYILFWKSSDSWGWRLILLSLILIIEWYFESKTIFEFKESLKHIFILLTKFFELLFLFAKYWGCNLL